MRRLRQFYQVFFLVLFVALTVVTAQGLLQGYPVTLFLDSSAFAGLAALLSSWNVAHTMWIGFLVLALTFILGRFYCGWICPLGTLFHFTSWLLRPRSAARRVKQNAYVRAQTYKYVLMTVLLVCAALGALQIGLLDPMVLLTRTAAVFFAPAVDAGAGILVSAEADRTFPTGPLIVAMFAGLLLLNAYRFRFWCRYVCPLGALLGLAGKFSLGAVRRDTASCTGCGLCAADCPAACSPDTKTRTAECYACWNCIDECPEGSLSWRWFPEREAVNVATDVSRRQFVGGLIGGISGVFALRTAGVTGRTGYPKRIRPPGSLAEEDFLGRCLKCGACMKVCPTNVLQPAWDEAGFEGFWSPVMNMRKGYCEVNCTLCGQVCPSGAIERMTIAQKTGHGGETPVKVGTAFVDRNRCLPWSFDRKCLVCQEVCPVSPKAIVTLQDQQSSDEVPPRPARPQVDPERCIGCGICEHECPVHDLAAIRVTAAGESREPGGSFYLS